MFSGGGWSGLASLSAACVFGWGLIATLTAPHPAIGSSYGCSEGIRRRRCRVRNGACHHVQGDDQPSALNVQVDRSRFLVLLNRDAPRCSRLSDERGTSTPIGATGARSRSLADSSYRRLASRAWRTVEVTRPMRGSRKSSADCTSMVSLAYLSLGKSFHVVGDENSGFGNYGWWS